MGELSTDGSNAALLRSSSDPELLRLNLLGTAKLKSSDEAGEAFVAAAMTGLEKPLSGSIRFRGPDCG